MPDEWMKEEEATGPVLETVFESLGRGSFRALFGAAERAGTDQLC